MSTRSDPFRLLGVPYDAGPDVVRRAWRRRALATHPDLGGSGPAFLEIRAAYEALSANLDEERKRWKPAPARLPPPVAPPPPPQPPRAAPNSLAYPTCPVVVSRGPNGRQKIGFQIKGCPPDWVPGAEPPTGGIFRQRIPPGNGRVAFGVWEVPLGDGMIRYVFGPAAG